MFKRVLPTFFLRGSLIVFSVVILKLEKVVEKMRINFGSHIFKIENKILKLILF